MKKILLITILLISFSACKKNTNEFDIIILEKHASGEIKKGAYNSSKTKELKFINTFYETGELESSFETKPDENNGIYKTYYKNGQIESIGNFKDGFAHGKSSIFHDNGIKMCDKTYYKNKVLGDVIYYDEKAAFDRYQNYNHLGEMMYDLENKNTLKEQGNKFAHIWVGLENEKELNTCKKGEAIIISLELANPPSCSKTLVTKINGVIKDSTEIEGLEYNYKVTPNRQGANLLECVLRYECKNYRLKEESISVPFVVN